MIKLEHARYLFVVIFLGLFVCSLVFSFSRGLASPSGTSWRVLGTTCPDGSTHESNDNLTAHLKHNHTVTQAQWDAITPKITLTPQTCVQTSRYAYGPQDGLRGNGLYSTYDYNLFFYGTPDAVASIDAFRADAFTGCKTDAERAARHTAVLYQRWNLASFYATPLLQHKHIVSLWDMLLVILGTSLYCEVVRLRRGGAATEHETRALRWIEYGLTSPFILVIIAIAGFVRDRSVLLLLFAGQLGLISHGYAIEIEFERQMQVFVGLSLFCRCFVVVVLLCHPGIFFLRITEKHGMKILQEQAGKRSFIALYVLLGVGFSVHVLLWVVLGRSAVHNVLAAIPCGGWGENNDENRETYEGFRWLFYFLLAVEVTLFSLFGLVFPVAARLYARSDARRDEQDVWRRCEVGYGLLNVLSKGLLFWLVFVIVGVMPPEVQV